MQYALLSSWALVAAAAQQNTLARSEFVRRYDKFVRRVLAKRWLNSPCRRYFDDAVNTVFVECIKPFGVIQKAQPEKGRSFRTLLFRVVCNVAARFECDHVRDTRTITMTDEYADLTESEQTVLEQLTREEITNAIRHALVIMLQSEDEAVRRRAQLLQQHTCDGLKIIHLAAGDPKAAETMHREHSKAKKEFEQILFSVIQMDYHCEPDEFRDIVNELFAAFS